MFSLVPLTLFVLDDVVVLLVHDGASEAVLRPERKWIRHCYSEKGDINAFFIYSYQSPNVLRWEDMCSRYLRKLDKVRIYLAGSDIEVCPSLQFLLCPDIA